MPSKRRRVSERTRWCSLPLHRVVPLEGIKLILILPLGVRFPKVGVEVEWKAPSPAHSSEGPPPLGFDTSDEEEELSQPFSKIFVRG